MTIEPSLCSPAKKQRQKVRKGGPSLVRFTSKLSFKLRQKKSLKSLNKSKFVKNVVQGPVFHEVKMDRMPKTHFEVKKSARMLTVGPVDAKGYLFSTKRVKRGKRSRPVKLQVNQSQKPRESSPKSSTKLFGFSTRLEKSRFQVSCDVRARETAARRRKRILKGALCTAVT